MSTSFRNILRKSSKSKEDDFSFMPSMTYVENQKRVNEIAHPLATITIDNKTHSEACFYVRKSDAITNVSQLKGKKWGGNILYHSKLIMHENGFDMPVDKFFSELHYYPDTDYKVWIQALLTGKIDVFAPVLRRQPRRARLLGNPLRLHFGGQQQRQRLRRPVGQHPVLQRHAERRHVVRPLRCDRAPP